MKQTDDRQSDSRDDDVLNPKLPSKRALVERAVEDGITDPKAIVVFAKDHYVDMTVKEVEAILAELKKSHD